MLNRYLGIHVIGKRCNATFISRSTHDNV